MEIKNFETIKIYILNSPNQKFVFSTNYLGDKVFLQEICLVMFSCCICACIVLHNIGHGFLKHKIWCMFRLFYLLNLMVLDTNVGKKMEKLCVIKQMT
jgi:ribosome biogenesis protein Nip4